MEDTLTKQIEKLNKSEKLLLVEALWDSIASEPEDVPLPEHHKSVLDERLKTLNEDTKKGESWDKFRKNYISYCGQTIHHYSRNEHSGLSFC